MEVRRLWINKRKKDYLSWLELLKKVGIREEKNIDLVIGIYEEDKLIATGAVFGNVIKCVAVCKKYIGGSVVGLLVSRLEELIYQDYDSCYLYTKPEVTSSFRYLGFQEIARVDDVLVFMEKALNGFSEYLKQIKKFRKPGRKQAALVINANPFTLGHQYLVEIAAKENDVVYVFVVSEDRSYVPFEDRYYLVQKGTEHLSNVVVLETGPYLISQATFPSYFLPEKIDVTMIQAKLDAILFKGKIAPAMNISYRYAGEEPLSKTTAIYNEQMKNVFDKKVQLIILERKRIEEQVISASIVRELWRKGDLKAIRPFVPQATFSYIKNHLEGV
ncbi:[citrate (pro-3S)-lyase] ligase [Marinilactibacillus sp. 15R]|uniref:[citrate (pro-3S)-lyase] ligase n=1 Tax=Marinilactibacillus sp. 15R TaxID=1911586 RepID=UPI000909A13B|nr:[citrate (pro-3S)-lyase] ligase [Marinilactibacillus sp. 15R]API88090.1 [citrate (pro-3S)-lyase] ligase [Marinilactibacillus sp. 15R]